MAGKIKIASYCSTFLKPEMLHIYRQVCGVNSFENHIITQTRVNSEKFPYEKIHVLPKLKSNFIRRFYLKYIRKTAPIIYRGESLPLTRTLAKTGAELLHVYFGHTGVHLLPIIKLLDIPAIVSFHGMDVQERRDQQGYAQKLSELLRFLPLVLCRSESLKRRLLALGCDESKIRLNGTGIPLENFPFCERELDGENWRITQACRLIEKKGLDVSLRAFCEFRKRYPRARFTIAGEGELLANLQKLARELKVADAVEFRGFLGQRELAKLYRESHIFLHPSQLTADQNQEGIPNSMLEAMATGLPVVATRHGGIPEAVEHEVSGLLAEERDEAGVLANLFKIATDADKYRRMSRNAEDRARQKFSLATSIANLEEIYHEALVRRK